MVDIHTHTVVDMLESREQEDVVKWLKTYPNIQVVSRDGSITYRNAISEAHPNAVQISDRFHLYKNLTDYAMQYLKKQLKVLIEVVVKDSPIQSDEIKLSKTNINRKLTLEEKYKEILQLQEKGKIKLKYVMQLIWTLDVIKS